MLLWSPRVQWRTNNKSMGLCFWPKIWCSTFYIEIVKSCDVYFVFRYSAKHSRMCGSDPPITHAVRVCVCVCQLFYYHEVPYPPDVGRFKDHVEWSGDISRKDASITLNRVPPTFNGTYICQVRNRPDVHGSNGEIFLRVVDKGKTADSARC